MQRKGYSQRVSLNFDHRPDPGKVDFLIFHYTSRNLPTSLDLLCGDQGLGQNLPPSERVSAHYLIDEKGQVYPLVSETHRAWHAGTSYWQGRTHLNDCSIGIELVNPGNRPYSEDQMQSLTQLSTEIVSRHSIRPHHVLGHEDIAPTRKQDPGWYFDWARLAQKGIGLFPFSEEKTIPERGIIPPLLITPSSSKGSGSKRASLAKSTIGGRAHDEIDSELIQKVQQLLWIYGYLVPTHGQLDFQTQCVLCAFARHFKIIPSEPSDTWTSGLFRIFQTYLDRLIEAKNASLSSHALTGV